MSENKIEEQTPLTTTTVVESLELTSASASTSASNMDKQNPNQLEKNAATLISPKKREYRACKIFW